MKTCHHSESCGTSFHGTTLIASPKELRKVLGDDFGASDKTNYDWTCKTEDGEVFTVYDWKTPLHPENRRILWNIGGFSGESTEKAKMELENALAKR